MDKKPITAFDLMMRIADMDLPRDKTLVFEFEGGSTSWTIEEVEVRNGFVILKSIG